MRNGSLQQHAARRRIACRTVLPIRSDYDVDDGSANKFPDRFSLLAEYFQSCADDMG